MRIPVAMERPEVATDPAAFAQHLITLVRRWVTTSLPARAGSAAALAPRRKGVTTQKFSIAPAWMDGKVDLAYELSQASATDPTSATQTIQQARQLIDLVVSDDLRPVIVLDDTDRWLSTSYQPDSSTVRRAFFGRVVRILAEDLGTAAIVALLPSYLDDPAYQASPPSRKQTTGPSSLPASHSHSPIPLRDRQVPRSGIRHFVVDQSELGGYRRESLVARPEAGTCCQQGRGQEVRIDVPDAEPEQLLVLDQAQHLGVGCVLRVREVAEQAHDLAATRQVAESELADHPRVGQHLAVLQQRGKLPVADPEVVDPD